MQGRQSLSVALHCATFRNLHHYLWPLLLPLPLLRPLALLLLPLWQRLPQLFPLDAQNEHAEAATWLPIGRMLTRDRHVTVH